MKKAITSLAVFTLIATGGYFTFEHLNTTKANNATRVISLSATHPIFNDLESIEDIADSIIEVEFTGERDTISWGEGEYQNSLSEVKINKVYRGELKEGDLIGVYEPAYFEDDTLHTVEGYNLMSENIRYIIFAKEFKDSNYSIIGMYQGKYDLDNREKVTTQKTNSNYLLELESEYLGDEENIKRFNKLKEQVVEKYNQEE